MKLTIFQLLQKIQGLYSNWDDSFTAEEHENPTTNAQLCEELEILHYVFNRFHNFEIHYDYENFIIYLLKRKTKLFQVNYFSGVYNN